MTIFSIRAALVAAVVLAPFGAHAADMARRAPPPAAYPMPVPAYANWTGVYGGINGGYGSGTSNWDPLVSGNPSPTGFVAGFTVGYNYQVGAWVWGMEGDIDFSNMKGSAACGAALCETRNDWLSTERLRLRYAGWSNWLAYLTGGMALGNVKASNSLAGSVNTTRFGWTAGAGVEYAMWSNWSVKAEYLYADLGSITCDGACGALPGDTVSFKANIIRGGVNYRF